MKLGAQLASRQGYLLLALIVLVADQATKVMAHAYLPRRGVVEIIPDFFNLAYSRNPGGLFGYFGDLPDLLRTLLLTLLPVVAVLFVMLLLARQPDDDRKTLLGLSLILGGAVGNLIDRVFRGEVVDFLDVYVGRTGLADWLRERFGTTHWPTFNIADSAIVCGACLLLLTIFSKEPTAGPGEPE